MPSLLVDASGLAVLGSEQVPGVFCGAAQFSIVEWMYRVVSVTSSCLYSQPSTSDDLIRGNTRSGAPTTVPCSSLVIRPLAPTTCSLKSNRKLDVEVANSRPKSMRGAL